MNLEYVEEFIGKIGFEWKREYYNSKARDYVVAEDWNDICSHNLRLTSLKLYKGEQDGYVDFFINEEHFIQYRDETEIQGSGSHTYVDKDYSDAWTRFQAEKTPEMSD